MLKALVKKQFLEMFRGYFVNRKNGQKRSSVSTVMYFLLFFGIFVIVGSSIYGMASGIAENLGYENRWLFMAIEGVISIVLGLFGSVFNTYAGLYLPKDNDLLFSMPIPPKTLLLSGMVGVYTMSVLYGGMVWIPAVIAYSVLYGFTFPEGLIQIILLFVLGLFITFLACVLGWFVALGAQKAKGKSFVIVLLTLVFIGIYYFFYFKAMDFIQSILTHIDEISKAMRTWLFYMSYVGKGATGDILSFVICIGITVVLFLICWYVMSKNYTKLALADNVIKSKEYTGGGLKKSDVKKALLKREFKHFSSSPVWMLNGGFGVIMLPAVGIVALIKANVLRDSLLKASESFPGLSDVLPVGVLVVVLLLTSLNMITPAAVSLEGKTIWITQSLPVSGKEILKAKEKMAVIITVLPVVLTSVLLSIASGLNVFDVIIITVTAVIYSWFISAFGLVLNLWKPNLTWTNEAVPVKQSMSVFIALFGSAIISIVIGLIGYFLISLTSSALIIVVLTILIALITLITNRWIYTKGADIYEHL